jgi:hypothetical protein
LFTNPFSLSLFLFLFPIRGSLVARLHAVLAHDRARRAAFDRTRAAAAAADAADTAAPDAAAPPDASALFRILSQSREGGALKLLCARESADCDVPMEEGSAQRESVVLLVLPHASAGALRLEAGRRLRAHAPWTALRLPPGGAAEEALLLSWNVTQEANE